MATLKDVAARAGVKVTTVSRMLNGRVHVSPETRERINAAMRDLGYYPNEMARSLALKNSSFIGLIVPSAENFFFAELIHHVEAAAEKYRCRLVLCVSNQDQKKEREYYRMLLSNKVMGVIMSNFSRTFDEVTRATAPFLVFDESAHPDIPCATTDDYQGGKLAGEHLISRGCRHLVFMSGNSEKNDVSRLRGEGLASACLGAGLEPPAQIEADWDEFITMNYEPSIEKVFREYPEADGIFASNDVIAAGIVRHCLRNRISIPKKMKIVGYDDTSFATQCAVPLTTIHQPIRELANHAVDCIVRRARGETVPFSTKFPVRLVRRETT